METDSILKGFTKKLGPLPAWAWGVVAAAGFWVYRNMKESGTSPASEESSSQYGTLASGGTMTIPAPPPATGYGMGLNYLTLPDGTYLEGLPEDLLALIPILPGYKPPNAVPAAWTSSPVPSITGSWDMQLLENGMTFGNNFSSQAECLAIMNTLSSPQLYRCIQK